MRPQFGPDDPHVSDTPKCCACFLYDCLFMGSCLEESRKVLRDDNYIKYSRQLSELHGRALLVNFPTFS